MRHFARLRSVRGKRAIRGNEVLRDPRSCHLSLVIAGFVCELDLECWEMIEWQSFGTCLGKICFIFGFQVCLMSTSIG